MQETCELCKASTGQHRSYFQLVKYRNDQKLWVREIGVFCDDCAKRIWRAAEAALEAREDIIDGKA